VDDDSSYSYDDEDDEGLSLEDDTDDTNEDQRR